MTSRCRAQIVTLLLAVVTGYAPGAFATVYRVELKNASRVVSTRTFNSLNPTSTDQVHHVDNGVAFEITDAAASCGIFLQKETRGQTNVIVSLIENKGGDKSVDLSKLKVVSKSGLLTKRTLTKAEQGVFPSGSGARRVSVEAPDLERSCTVSLI